MSPIPLIKIKTLPHYLSSKNKDIAGYLPLGYFLIGKCRLSLEFFPSKGLRKGWTSVNEFRTMRSHLKVPFIKEGGSLVLNHDIDLSTSCHSWKCKSRTGRRITDVESRFKSCASYSSSDKSTSSHPLVWLTLYLPYLKTFICWIHITN